MTRTALEAAERCVLRQPYHGSSDVGATVCGFCNEEVGMFWEEDGPRHAADCPWPALVAALRGDA